MFIERCLCCFFTGICLGPNHKLYTNYADDIKLICKSTTELGAIYKELQSCLAQLGLCTEGSKCKLLVIGPQPTTVTGILDDTTPELVTEIRFLGLKINHHGNIDRWKVDFNAATWALWTRLKDTGLACYPRAFTKAYSVFIQPAVLFGVEIWGLKEILKICTHKKSPYTNE